MKKASKKTASKKTVTKKARGRQPGPVRKIQALVTVEVREGPISKRGVADAVKTSFLDYTEGLPSSHKLSGENLKRIAVNVNI